MVAYLVVYQLVLLEIGLLGINGSPDEVDVLHPDPLSLRQHLLLSDIEQLLLKLVLIHLLVECELGLGLLPTHRCFLLICIILVKSVDIVSDELVDALHLLLLASLALHQVQLE